VRQDKVFVLLLLAGMLHMGEQEEEFSDCLIPHENTHPPHRILTESACRNGVFTRSGDRPDDP
jgi:hypothetical protein